MMDAVVALPGPFQRLGQGWWYPGQAFFFWYMLPMQCREQGRLAERSHGAVALAGWLTGWLARMGGMIKRMLSAARLCVARDAG